MLVMVDYIREMTVKKSCKCGEYGSYEHVLFLLSFLFLSLLCLITVTEDLNLPSVPPVLVTIHPSYPESSPVCDPKTCPGYGQLLTEWVCLAKCDSFIALSLACMTTLLA